ncbi:xanthine dehydrogenase/oxidase [Platysternon megacephalum]|uniref:Xanthine dehydrogenase/oxidase n=1 Tax=Platysternon megacephalum TaxID=55544 RepID=A0A4D9EJI6_9SAUR|nr:xanthine dehydrogenase/oxidase [Platysternon megacephalum]
MLLPILLLLCLTVLKEGSCEYGLLRVRSDQMAGNGTQGKDYCTHFSSEMVLLPHYTDSAFCSPHSHLSPGAFRKSMPAAMWDHCSLCEKGRLAQLHGAQGLLVIVRETLGSFCTGGGNRSCQCPEIAATAPTLTPFSHPHCMPVIAIPMVVLHYSDMLDIRGKKFSEHPLGAAMYLPTRPSLDYSMATLFILAVGTVMIGGYWAGLVVAAKPQHTEHQDEEDEEFSDKAVDCTLTMICVTIATSSSLLRFSIASTITFVCVVIGIFCCISSKALYSCLSPFVRRIPLGECKIHLPCLHKSTQVRMLLLKASCSSIILLWWVFRNEDRWAWILPDALGVAYCLFMIKSIHMPTMKNCTFYVLTFLVADVLYIFISPFLAQSRGSIMEVAAHHPSDSAINEKILLVLKVPNLNSSPLDFCGKACKILGLGDILSPGFLVTYCHKFDIQVQLSKGYYVASTVAYGIGLLGTFGVRALLQTGQPALLYLVPCMLITSLLVALWCQELTLFWTGRGFEKNLPHLPLEKTPASYPDLSNNSIHQHLSKKRPIPYSAEKDHRNE